MTWADLAGRGVTVAPSRVESERFGLTLARVVVGRDAAWDDDVRRALVAAGERDEQVLVARWPADLVECAAALAVRRDLLPADTLTYWEASAADLARTARDLPPGLAVLPGATVPASALGDAVGRAFAGYVNHYAANPLLDRGLALEGYVEWVRRTVADDAGHGAVVVHDGAVVGLATWVEDPEAGLVEILLAGLVPEARGRRWYAFLLAEIGRLAGARNLPRVVISTQAGNVPVQRAWTRAGFAPFAAVTTVHAVVPGLLGAGGAAG